MKHKLHIRYIKTFFGLGFGIERSLVYDYNIKDAKCFFNIKIYLGPIIIYTTPKGT